MAPLLPPPRLVRRILGGDAGYVATPTATANHAAPSMQKWPGCRRLVALSGGSITPELWEWLMGLPVGWTDLQPLETRRFQQWLSAHGSC
jgi:hypothetical protein